MFVHPVAPPNWQAVAPDVPRPMLEYLFDSARAASNLLTRGVLARYPGITAWLERVSGQAGHIPITA